MYMYKWMVWDLRPFREYFSESELWKGEHELCAAERRYGS